jgi:hypothetical protein
MLILDDVPGEGSWRLVMAAHLPHYTSLDVITGTVIFVALIVAVAVARCGEDNPLTVRASPASGSWRRRRNRRLRAAGCPTAAL